jgi:transcriptional regulator with XRE-family HTH domain
MQRSSKRVRKALKQLRKITGEIQSTFASSVGVSFPLIRGIENGVRRLTHNTANLITAATGCRAEALMKGKLLNREGKPYTKEDYKRHKSSDIDDEGYELLGDTLRLQNKAFEILLSLPSARQKIYTLETLFNQFVEQAITTLECDREYDRELIKIGGPIGKALAAMRPRRKAKAAAKKPHGQPKITPPSGWKTETIS